MIPSISLVILVGTASFILMLAIAYAIGEALQEQDELCASMDRMQLNLDQE